MKGHRKGNSGELEVITYLQPWWRRLEPEAAFVRTPRSGGWGSTKTQGFKARGDVMVDPDTCKLFPFSVEVKRREAWSPEVFLSGRKSPAWSWWAQTCKAADGDGQRPMLWFRRNREAWWVMIESAVFDRLRLRGMSAPLVRFPHPRHTVVLTDAQTLWIPPRSFVVACTP